MPKRKKSRKKPTQKKYIIRITLGLTLLFFLLFVLRLFQPSHQKIASDQSRNSIQLETFTPTPTLPPEIPTPTPTNPPTAPNPTPTPYIPPPPVDNGTCVPDAWITDGCTCIGTRQIWVYCGTDEPYTGAPRCISFGDHPNPVCDNILKEHPECRAWCEAKPIIYLYPPVPTLVDVEIKTPGTIFISDPLYPAGGWKNVLAQPNGDLLYQGKEYKELFYEIDHKELNIPKNGTVIEKGNLSSEIKKILLAYGLNDHEVGEFLKFWIPKLQNLNKPYIQFSVFPKEDKEAMDKIVMNPEADTRIEVIAYFKGLDNKIDLTPLKIPQTPIRSGFVMVAWGGVLDAN